MFMKLLKLAGFRRKPNQYAVPPGECSGAAGEQQIESFYQALEAEIRSLEKSLPPDSLSFRVEWLQVAVSFLQQTHSNTFQLVEKLWLPVRSISAGGSEYLNEYLDGSMRLLEVCNNLREGLNQLETYQLGLELALKRLTLASEIPQQKGSQLELSDSFGDSSNHLDPLNESRQELERLESSMSMSQKRMWMGFLDSSHGGVLPARPGTSRPGRSSSALLRSASLQLPPVSPRKKEKREVSHVLYDVQLVTSYVSRILFWVLTGQSRKSGDFWSEVGSLEPSSKLQRSGSWPTLMFHLKEIVLEQSFPELQNSRLDTNLLDLMYFQKSLASLRVELKAGFKEGKLTAGTAFSERIKKQLEQQKQKLGELSSSLETISVQLNDLYTEIIERRKQVLDRFERSLHHHASA